MSTLCNLVGIYENLVPIVGHILGHRMRRIRQSSSILATRPEHMVPVETAELRPRLWRLDRYLFLTDGLDLKQGRRGTMPPLYPTAWALGLYLKLLGDPKLGLSLLGVVHVRNDLIVRRPLDLQAPLSLSLSVERLHRDDRRALMTVLCEFRVRGAVSAETRTVLLSGVSPAEAAREAAKPVGDIEQWTEIRRIALDRHHALRYSLFSGDVNPLHLYPWTSRHYGFDAPILHGFCLKSIVAHALVRREGRGRFETLKRLRLRYRSAVALPSTLLVQTRDRHVRVVDLDSRALIADGRFRIDVPESS